MRRNYERTRGHKHSVWKYSSHVNNRAIDQEQNKIVARNNDWNWDAIPEMFLRPKIFSNVKKNYYFKGTQFKTKICRGSLGIFLFMQIRNFLTDLCWILAVLRI